MTTVIHIYVNMYVHVCMSVCTYMYAWLPVYHVCTYICNSSMYTYTHLQGTQVDVYNTGYYMYMYMYTCTYIYCTCRLKHWERSTTATLTKWLWKFTKQKRLVQSIRRLLCSLDVVDIPLVDSAGEIWEASTAGANTKGQKSTGKGTASCKQSLYHWCTQWGCPISLRF